MPLNASHPCISAGEGGFVAVPVIRDICENDHRVQECACGEAPERRGDECGHWKSSAMVYGQEHGLEKLFSVEEAIEQGTLFAELFKPMAECSHCGGEEPSVKQRLAFAAWELRLYLDTHPGCRQALRLYEELENLLQCPNYATTFAVDGSCCDKEGWNWTDNPWPWENHAYPGRR